MLSCRGCAVCIAKGEGACPKRDDLQAVVQRMRKTDGVVLALVANSRAVSGQFRVFVHLLEHGRITARGFT